MRETGQETIFGRDVDLYDLALRTGTSARILSLVSSKEQAR